MKSILLFYSIILCLLNIPAQGQLIASFMGSPPTCAGLNNGTLCCVSITNGVPPYSCSLIPNIGTNGSNSNCFSDLPPGTYTISITDQVGNVGSVNAIVMESLYSPIQVSATITPTLAGINTGEICLTTTGGAGGNLYYYGLSGIVMPSTTDSCITELSVGTYTIYIDDTLSGCFVDTTFTLDYACILDGDWSSISVTCPGLENGAICCDSLLSNQPGLGLPPYTCILSPALGTNIPGSNCFYDLPPNTYTVQTISSDGCTGIIYNLIVSVFHQAVNLEAVITPSGTDTNSGEICVSLSGASGDYSLSLTSSLGQLLQINQDSCFTNLAAGEYSFNVYDNAWGCSIDSSFTIEEIQLNVFHALTNTACPSENECGGSLSITISGIPPFVFNLADTNINLQEIFPSDTTIQFTEMCPGEYLYSIDDQFGNHYATTFQIANTPLLSASVATINDNGAGTGSIIPQVSGGTPPYEFLWSNNSSDQSAENLIAGSYSLTITDSNGCTFEVNDIQIGLVGINDQLRKRNVLCSPNPFNEKFVILNTQSNAAVRLVDHLGKTAFYNSKIQAGEVVDSRNIPCGIYKMIILNDDGSSEYLTVVKCD